MNQKLHLLSCFFIETNKSAVSLFELTFWAFGQIAPQLVALPSLLSIRPPQIQWHEQHIFSIWLRCVLIFPLGSHVVGVVLRNKWLISLKICKIYTEFIFLLYWKKRLNQLGVRVSFCVREVVQVIRKICNCILDNRSQWLVLPSAFPWCCRKLPGQIHLLYGTLWFQSFWRGCRSVV